MALVDYDLKTPKYRYYTLSTLKIKIVMLLLVQYYLSVNQDLANIFTDFNFTVSNQKNGVISNILSKFQ